MRPDQLAELRALLEQQAARETIHQPEPTPGRPTLTVASPPAADGDETRVDPAPTGENPADRGPTRAAVTAPPARKPPKPMVLVIARLQKRFPLAFPKRPASKVPLKVGIFEDLLERAETLGLTEQRIRGVLKIWCRTERYRLTLVEGATRVDLDGQPAGVVLAKEVSASVRAAQRRQANEAGPADVPGQAAQAHPLRN